jgi:hypothetical protein
LNGAGGKLQLAERQRHSQSAIRNPPIPPANILFPIIILHSSLMTTRYFGQPIKRNDWAALFSGVTGK